MRVFLCLIIFITISCCDSNTDQSNTCIPVIFDDSKFNSSENFGINLIDFSIDGSCLTVTLGVTGCDDDHTIDMVSDGSIAESFPPQITFDFFDNDLQACDAVFSVERKYDLGPIQDLYDKEIIIRFRNSEKSFTYSQ